MKKRNWILLLALFIVFTNCKNSEKDSIQTTDNNNDTLPKFDSLDWANQYKFQKTDLIDKANKYRFLDKFYHDFWMQKNVSGGFLVAQHGKIIYEGYSGYSDIEKQIPLTAETPIHIASITKVLTGLAVLKLIEFDKIKLNDKVSKYLEGFPYDNVTIEDLLNHRSGLPNYLHLSDDKNYWDNSKMITNQDVLDILTQKKPEATGVAGKNFSYNNTNFVLLALIIEKVTGLSYPKAMKKMVFDPLGMKNTFVMEFEKDADRVSKSYYNNGRPWNYDHLDITYGDKNVYSTPRDLFKMDVAMYSDKFLPKKLKDKAWKGYSYESKGVKNYGLGIRLMEWENGGKILYHNGWWHGNNSTYVRDFENEATIISLGNRKNRTIYSTFRLVSLFGDYPFQFPDASDTGSGNAEDSLKNLEKQMDSVKHKTRKDKVENLEGKVDSIKGKNKK